jgi:hypothetical protein
LTQPYFDVSLTWPSFCDRIRNDLKSSDPDQGSSSGSFTLKVNSFLSHFSSEVTFWRKNAIMDLVFF